MKSDLGTNIAKKPPMGWNSYNCFCCDPTDELIRSAADAMVAGGFLDAGYTYLNIDDGWMAKERDADGNLVPHPEKFPNGIKPVVDYIHSKGLKAGTYLGAGLRTYGEYPGSLGYEARDAKLIAGYGFDLLKYDYRTLPEDPERITVRGEYERMRDALIATGRPIFFSICEHGRSNPWEWGAEVGHIWRTTPDIKDGYDGKISWGMGFNAIIEHNIALFPYAGPGGWNDPDMLVVGLNGTLEWQGPGCTMDEYRTHFALWCLSAAPLIMGCDLAKLDRESKTILLNKELIAVNQDALGKQGRIAYSEGDIRVWVKELEGGAYAVGMHNNGPEPATIALDADKAGIVSQYETITDLWTGEKLALSALKAIRIPSHGTAVYRIG